MSVMNVVCCQGEVSAASRSLVQRSPTECGVSECDREASTMRRPWSTGWVGGGAVAPWGKNCHSTSAPCLVVKVDMAQFHVEAT